MLLGERPISLHLYFYAKILWLKWSIGSVGSVGTCGCGICMYFLQWCANALHGAAHGLAVNIIKNHVFGSEMELMPPPIDDKNKMR
jgi:hypothetical protein